MKTKVLIFAFMMSTVVFAKTSAERALDRKLVIIKSVSGECYKNIRKDSFGNDLTVFKFLSVIALNSEVSISASLSKFKSESGENCSLYAQKIEKYISENDELFEVTSNGIEKCSEQDAQFKTDLNNLISTGNDLTSLYIEFKTLDFSSPEVCAAAKEKMNIELKANP